MNLIQRFLAFIQSNQLFQKNDRLLIAVSGGSDSVALCELCYQGGYHFEMAHCNFQLRGEESERDEKFVRKLAEKYAVPLHSKRFETKEYSNQHKVSTQIAARELRYSWFDELIQEMRKEGAAFLLTAHHLDDSIETLLMNFFRGTGIRGLQGIPLKAGYIRRPLLFATKKEILEFLIVHNLEYVEDSTNLTEDYTRNYFRNNLLPAIIKAFPSAEDNLADNLIRFKDVLDIYDEAIEQKIKKLAYPIGNEIHIPVLKLNNTTGAAAVLYEIVKNYGFTSHQIGDILHLMVGESGRYVNSSTHKIFRNRAWLILTSLQTSDSEQILIEESQNEIPFSGGHLNIQQTEWNSSMKIPADEAIALLDASGITFPLLLRKWKQGDYFYPLGMQKKKKLSKFFIDNKLSLSEKENVWVVESNKRIIWIVGMRIDNRFKITSGTRRIIKMRVQKG